MYTEKQNNNYHSKIYLIRKAWKSEDSGPPLSMC